MSIKRMVLEDFESTDVELESADTESQVEKEKPKVEGLLIDAVLEKEEKGEPGVMSLSSALLSEREEKEQEVIEAAKESKELESEVSDDDLETTDGPSSSSSDSGSDGDDSEIGDDMGDDIFGDLEDFSFESFSNPASVVTNPVSMESYARREWGFFDPLITELNIAEENRKAFFNVAVEELVENKSLTGNNDPNLIEGEVEEDNSLVEETTEVRASMPKDEDGEPIDPETAVAYVKEPIIESLTGFGEIARKYMNNISSHIDSLQESLPKLDERLLNFEKIKAQGKLDFTDKLFTDVSVTKNIYFRGAKSIRDTLQSLKRYLDDSAAISKVMVNTPFDRIKDVFNNEGFIDKGEVLDYKKQVSGFHVIKASIPAYDNYLRTNPSEFKYYAVKEENPGDIYDIPGVLITDMKDLDYFVEGLKEIVLRTGVSVDLLKVINKNFSDLTDKIKLLRVDVQDDQYENLSDIGIDDILKDFILLKLTVEMITSDINITFSYISSFVTVIEACVKFVDPVEKDKETNPEDWEDEEQPDEESPIEESSETELDED